MKPRLKDLSIRATAFCLAVAGAVHAQQLSEPDHSFKPDGLEASVLPGTSCTGFWKTPSFQCRPIQIPAYFARAKDGSRSALVVISGNAGGLDARHLDYSRFLADHNISAVILDSFVARGHTGGVGRDLNMGRTKGLDAVNMSIDAVTAAAVLAAQPEWSSAKIGYLGESLGGSTAINVVRPYIEGIVKEQNPSYRMRNFDAVAALYPACLDRNTIERFKRIPFLLIQPSKDAITTPETCVRQAEWMNARGGNVKLVMLPDEHHDYDAPWALKHLNSQNTSKCSNIRDGDKFTLESNGKEFPATPQGYNDMTSSCVTRGFMTGNRGKPRVGYDLWLAHFKQHLMQAK